MAPDDDLEPLDSAESLYRALRKEAGLTRVGAAIMAIVVLAAGVVAIVAWMYAGFTRSEHRGLIALAILGAGLVVGPLLALAVAGVDAGIRRIFGLGDPAAPSAPDAVADAALREAWRLGLDDADWTEEAMHRAERLRPTLIDAGYAEIERDGQTWHFTERGVSRAEELGL